MFRCRSMRGLIAASLYEVLPEADQHRLDAHTASCSRCRKERESLAQFHATALASTLMPAEAVDNAPDLLPLIRPVIRAKTIERTEKTERHWFSPGFVPRVVSVGTLVALVAAGLFLAPRIINKPKINATLLSSTTSDATPASDTYVKARALIRRQDYTGAYKALQAALTQYPNDAHAAELAAQLGDVAFTYLKWYPEAYQAYEQLAQRYPVYFTNNGESVHRRELLTEAKEKDYAPLYALDSARRQAPEDQFAQLEKVVSRYPATFVASLAVEDMGRCIDRDGTDAAVSPGSVMTRTAALEKARAKCSDPLTVAQLDLEIAHGYWKELNSPEKARTLYETVAHNSNPVLAHLAEKSRLELDAALKVQ